MKHLTFLLLGILFSSSSCDNILIPNDTELSGKVSNPTYENGKITFQMNGGTYTVGCLESDYKRIVDWGDNNITIEFNKNFTEITHINGFVPALGDMIWWWLKFFFWGVILLGCIITLAEWKSLR